jgi:hypothetical protein
MNLTLSSDLPYTPNALAIQGGSTVTTGDNPFLGVLQTVAANEGTPVISNGVQTPETLQAPETLLVLTSAIEGEISGNGAVTIDPILNVLTTLPQGTGSEIPAIKPDILVALQGLADSESGLLPPVPDLDLTIDNFDASGEPLPDVSTLLLLDGAFLGKEAGLLERITAQINAIQKDGKASGVLFNLTPEQLTQLQEDITLAQESGDFPVLPDGVAAFIVIVPPKNENTDELASIQIFPFAHLQTDTVPGETAESQSQLNNLLQRVQDRNFDDLLAIRTPEEKFSALLRNAAGLNAQLASEGNTSSTSSTKKPRVDFSKDVNFANAQAIDEKTTANATTPSGALEGLPVPDGDFLAALDFENGTAVNFTSGAPKTPAAGLQDLSSVTTQARHASQTHPGTTLIAAHMKQATGTGESRVLTLQLDPPELGRVEVRMEFGQDKTLKTKIIVEKPEAHFMLQRDAHILERAMQATGIEAEGSSLSFELAEDGQGFNQDGRHDGSRNQARSNSGDQQDLEIIETSMTWHVDPETGHMRYNILA